MNHMQKHVSSVQIKKLLDPILILFFAIYALIYSLGRWGGSRPVLLIDPSGDAGALLSYAAALDHPQFFANDQILNPQNQMFSYNGIYLPFIRLVGSAVGDYGLGFLTLLPVCIFLQLVSFYLFGKAIFHNRFWAVLLSAISAVPIVYGFWDSWGLAYDPLPRFLFQSIFPFFLLLFVKWSESPKKWPLLMGMTSMLFFIHVISTPALAFMLWSGFFLYLPKNWNLSRKLLFQLLNGLVFCVPFIIFVQLSGTTAGITVTAENTYAEIMQYLNTNFRAFTDIKASLGIYFKVLGIYNILIPAAAGIVLAYLTKTNHELKTNLILVWLAACVFISLLIPYVEHQIEAQLGIPPIQFDLVRNLRYSIPLFEILGISGFAILEGKLTSSFSGKILGQVIGVIVCMAGFFWVYYAITRDSKVDQSAGLDFAVQEINCINNGRLFCPDKEKVEEQAALKFISSETAQDSVFLAMPDDLLANEIRYAGLRSVSFTRLDKNRIAYAHLDKAVQVEEISKEWFEMLDQHPDDFVEWAQELSCQNGVSHWLVDKTSEPAMSFTSISGTAVFDNDSFSIIKLNPCSQ